MALIGETQMSELPIDARIDAEYHIGPGAAERESIRKRGKPFSDCFLQIVHPGEFTREYQSSGHLFLRAQNVRPGRIEIRNPAYVSDKIYNSLPEALASAGDLLIVRTGANVGDVAWVPIRYAGALVSSHTLRLIPQMDAPIHAIAAFFASDLGQRVLTSVKTGGAQGQINGSSLKTLHLPKLEVLETKCRELLKEIDELTEQSERGYPEVETELLDRLGWKELPSRPVGSSYEHNFGYLATAARADAEFFHPQYTRLRTQLTKRGTQAIGTFCPKPSRGVQPFLFETGDVIVIDSKAVRPQGVEPSPVERTTRAFYESPKNAKGRVHYGDVLLNSTGRGTLGRAACYQLNGLAVCDNHVAIVRPNSEVCLPEYLSLFLNSPPGLAQSERFQTGSSGQLEIYPEHIQQFLVFLPRQKNGALDMAWQKRLVDKVKSATIAKLAARAKLEEAKQLVERSLSALNGLLV